MMQIPASGGHQVQPLLPSRKTQSHNGSLPQPEKIQQDRASLQGSSSLSPHHNNQQTISNVVNAISMLQLADDSLEEIHGGLNELQSLHSLALKIPGHTSQQTELQAQADDILAGIQDILESTTFNGSSLLTEHTQHTVMTNQESDNAVAVSTYNLDHEFNIAGLYGLKIGAQNPEQTNQAIHNSFETLHLVRDNYDRQKTEFSHQLHTAFSNQIITGAQPESLSLTNTIKRLTDNPHTLIQAQANINAEKSINLLTK
ncbi:hypothetical protein CBF23_014140 [Marinomonas agarivorans]|nr:hypothetical protein CBF23_014140 [Marinomonas agarivorans]